MTGQSTPTRPRRSAAVEAQVKVEESYETWGQPPSENEVKGATPRRKRSATTESSAGRKRRRTSVQHHDKPSTPTVLQKTEAEDDTPTQPVKRGLGRSSKNQFRRWAVIGAEESTKITPRVPDSPAFKEALRQIRDAEENAGPSAESHFTGQAIVIESVADDAGADYSTCAESPNETTDERTGSMPPSIFKPISAEQPVLRKIRTNYLLNYVRPQVPEILQDDTQTDTSGPGAETIAAGSLEEATRYRTADLELEGAPSEPEIPRRDGNHTDWLEQMETAARVQEGQCPVTRSSATAPSFGSERTNTAFELSSSAVQSPSDFAGTYHFRTPAISEYFRPKTAAIAFEADENATTSSAFPERARGPNEHALQTQMVSPILQRAPATTQQPQILPGGQPFSNKSSKIHRSQTLYRGTPSSPRFTYEKQGWYRVRHRSEFKHTMGKASAMKNTDMQSTSPEPPERRSSLSTKPSRPRYEQDDDHSPVFHESIHATPNPLSEVGSSKSDVDEFVIQRKPVSVHPPPMNRQTPNIYFDRNPRGSSVGIHSLDPFVGLPDHSDPRTFHTPNSKDWPHVLAALQPSIDHFRQLTNGTEPREMPLDSGYEVAHILLQAHLRSWFVINRPDYSHKEAIPKLFKLERWEGGVEHWKFASNSPVRPMPPARLPGSISTIHRFPACTECKWRNVFCSGFWRGRGKGSACIVGEEGFKCSEPQNSAYVAPSLQNYPPCHECARDNLYCHGFQKDIQNRCEPCLKKGHTCSYDMARFEKPVRI